MELQQLRNFICVAEHQNISKAAAELPISQSALSRSIRGLEESVGAVLFQRKGNSIQLTSHGEILLNRAREMLELEQKACQELMDQNNKEQVPIRLVIRCIEAIFPRIISSFKMQYPNVRFTILQNDDLAIRNQQFDIMISGRVSHMGSYGSKKLMDERLLCAISRDHPLAGKDSLSVEEFSMLPQIQFGGHRQIQYTIREHMQTLGLDFSAVMICDDVRTACGFAAMGHGALLIPEFAIAQGLEEQIRLLPIEHLNLTREVYIFWHKNNYLPEYAKKFRSLAIGYDYGQPMSTGK